MCKTCTRKKNFNITRYAHTRPERITAQMGYFLVRSTQVVVNSLSSSLGHSCEKLPSRLWLPYMERKVCLTVTLVHSGIVWRTWELPVERVRRGSWGRWVGVGTRWKVHSYLCAWLLIGWIRNRKCYSGLILKVVFNLDGSLCTKNLDCINVVN